MKYIYLGLIIISGLCFGKCPKNQLSYTTDSLGCKTIHMSQDKWTTFYYYSVQYDSLKKIIPTLKTQRNAQKRWEKEKRETLKAQLENSESHITYVERKRKELQKANFDLRLDVSYYKSENKKLKKQRWTVGGIGFLLGVLTSLAL